MSAESVQCTQAFNDASKIKPPKKKATRAASFSVRLSDEERAFLEERAGNQPLGAYIRQTLLEGQAHKRRAVRKPHIEQVQFAALLSALGESRVSSNLNQLARHANVGTLDVSQDIEAQLEDACGAVLVMRETLLMALGLKTGRKP